jgi:hypothetical protein
VTNLFTGLTVATVTALAMSRPRRRRIEFRDFMDFAMESAPGYSDHASGRGLHVVPDNRGSRKCRDWWLASRPNVFFHFTPASGSRFSLAKAFFGKRARRSLKSGSFKDLDALETAIMNYVKFHNDNPEPRRWRRRQVKGSQPRNTTENFCD